MTCKKRWMKFVWVGFLGWFGMMVWSPSQSLACSALPFFSVERSFWPADAAKNVPTNARILITLTHQVYPRESKNHQTLWKFLAHFELRAKGGGKVLFTQQQWTKHGLQDTEIKILLTPTDRLEANTTYELLSPVEKVPCDYGKDAKNPCVIGKMAVVSSFTTGAGEDTTAPTFAGAKPISLKKVGAYKNSCGMSFEGAFFSVDWKAGKDSSGLPVRYNIYRFSDSTVPVLRFVEKSLSWAEAAFICKDGKNTDALTLRLYKEDKLLVRAVDLAGNEDKNSAYQVVKNPCLVSTPVSDDSTKGAQPSKVSNEPADLTAKQVGCQQVSSNGLPLSWMLLGLFGLFGLVRRTTGQREV